MIRTDSLGDAEFRIIDQVITGLEAGRPEDTALDSVEVGGGDDVIQLQHAAIGDPFRVGAIEVAFAVGPLADTLRAPFADRDQGAIGDGLIHQRVVQQILNGAQVTVTGERIGVEIAGDDELGVFGQPTLGALVIGHVVETLDVVVPEGDLGAVVLDGVTRRVGKDRRGRVGDQEVDHLIPLLGLDPYRHISMVLGGERVLLPGCV